jgi:hypothetical protein
MKDMNEKRVRATEVWERLDDFLGEAEMDRLEKLSPEEVRAELAAAGLLKEEGAETTRDVATEAPSGPKLAPAEPTSPAVVAARFDERAPEAFLSRALPRSRRAEASRGPSARTRLRCTRRGLRPERSSPGCAPCGRSPSWG